LKEPIVAWFFGSESSHPISIPEECSDTNQWLGGLENPRSGSARRRP
jgi:hypothetical protein